MKSMKDMKQCLRVGRTTRLSRRRRRKRSVKNNTGGTKVKRAIALINALSVAAILSVSAVVNETIPEPEGTVLWHTRDVLTPTGWID